MWSRSSSNRPVEVPKFGVIRNVALTVASLALAVGGFLLSASASSQRDALQHRAGLAVSALVVVFVFVLIVRNSGIFREKRLRTMRPGSIVLRSFGNSPFTRALRQIRRLNGSNNAMDSMPMFMTAVAYEAGIEFWGRQFTLERLEFLPWSSIENIEAGEVPETIGSARGLTLTVRVASELVVVPFTVHSFGVKSAIPGLVYVSQKELNRDIEQFHTWAEESVSPSS